MHLLTHTESTAILKRPRNGSPNRYYSDRKVRCNLCGPKTDQNKESANTEKSVGSLIYKYRMTIFF